MEDEEKEMKMPTKTCPRCNGRSPIDSAECIYCNYAHLGGVSYGR